jgi:hypothetical protein
MAIAYVACIRFSETTEQLGSGILIGARLVLTCEHVVRGLLPTQTLTLEFHGKSLTGNLRAGSPDPQADLALIDLHDDAAAAPPAWSDRFAGGATAHIAGWPAGTFRPVPAKVQEPNWPRFNVHNTIHHGASGGAVVHQIDAEPHCIGIAVKGETPVSEVISKSTVEAYLAKHGISLPTAVPPPPPPPRRYDTTRYFEDLRRDTGEIDLDSLGVPREGARRPVMDALYIPLRTPNPNNLTDSTTLESALQHRLLLVVGDAGSGKTTFLRRIAWELCPKPESDLPRNKLALPCTGFPMFVRVSALDRHIHESNAHPEWEPFDPRWLAHFLASQPGSLGETFFQEKLEGNDNILLLDGLDEAAGEIRRADIAKLVNKASVRGCRYVVSTRPYDHRRAPLPNFAKCEVLPLGDPAIHRFLETWCNWLPRDQSYLDGLVHDVYLTPPDLRGNPFMLTALAVVYLQQKRLPNLRAELYEAIVDWLSIQAEERWGPPDHQRHFILNCLERLALAMQQWEGGRATLISVGDAAPVIADQFDPEPPRAPLDEARAFLERAHAASGILTLKSGLPAFWHKLFQEYLAARRLTFMDAADRTKTSVSFLYSAEGREVLPLAAVRMKDQFDYLPKLFTALIADAAAKDLKDQAHAVGVIGTMIRDLKSTKWKLPPRVEQPYQALLSEVHKIFDANYAPYIPLQSRLEAAVALGAAGDSRLLAPADPGYWIPIADFHIGRYPVTVQEYRDFLAANPTWEKPPDWPAQEEFLNRPVTTVSWHDATKYCDWCSRNGWRVTLPIDEQWELAACGTGPEKRKYPWGPKEPTPEHANYYDTGIRRAPTPVGLFPLGNTPEGISDMAGNVWEWTRSPYDDEDENVKSVRGGSFINLSRFLRAAGRLSFVAGDRDIGLGFRCIRE